MRYAVIGAGSWGTTVGALLADTVDTILWARREAIASEIDRNHTNRTYLDGFDLPPSLRATDDLAEALTGADVIVMGVPSHGYREVLVRARASIAPDTPIISLTKGIEADTLMRMTEVTLDVLPEHDPRVVGVLTGPNLAREIMEGQPAATVVAIPDLDVGRAIQHVVANPRFRVYTNPDVVGSEVAGAVKNVMAIAAGMAAGRGYGDNTLATLVTRALVEVSRLGVAMGGDVRTFSGLAGIGDLVATCNSSQSRNHRVGFELGRGRSLDEIISEMNMVAEGVKSTRGVLALAERYDVELPIAEKVGEVLYDGLDVIDALHQLMTRQMGSEFGEQ